MYGEFGTSNVRSLTMKEKIENPNDPRNTWDFKFITDETIDWFIQTKAGKAQGVAKQQNRAI